MQILSRLRTLLLLSLSATLGCAWAQATQPHAAAHLPDKVAARLNGVSISEAAIDAALPAEQRNDLATRSQALQHLIAQELFWQEAKKAKLASPNPSSEATKQRAIQTYIKQNLKPTLPSEAELQARYRAILKNLGPTEYRISLIETHDEATLKQAQSALQNGQNFAHVAQRYSIGATAQKGGEIDWLSFPQPLSVGHTQGLPMAYAQAIVALKPGKVSPPIHIAGRWALIHLDSTRPTLIPDFATTRPMLYRALYIQSVQTASLRLTQGLLKPAKLELAPRYQAHAAKP